MALVKQHDHVRTLESQHALVQGAYQQGCTDHQSECDKLVALQAESEELKKLKPEPFERLNLLLNVIVAQQHRVYEVTGPERGDLAIKLAEAREERDAATDSFRQMLEKRDSEQEARGERKRKKAAERALRKSKKLRPLRRVVHLPSTKKGSGVQGHRGCPELFRRSLGGESTFAQKNGITSMDGLHKRIANEHYNIQVNTKHQKNGKAPTKDEHALWTNKGRWSGDKFVELFKAWCNTLDEVCMRQATLDNFLEEFDQVRTRKCNRSDSVQHLIAKYLNPSVFPRNCKVPTADQGDKYKTYKSYQPHTTVMNKALHLYNSGSAQDEADEEDEADDEDDEDEEKAPPLDEGVAVAAVAVAASSDALDESSDESSDDSADSSSSSSSSSSSVSSDSEASVDESDYERIAITDSLPGKRKRKATRRTTTEDDQEAGKVARYTKAKAKGVRRGTISFCSNPDEDEEDRDSSC